MDRCQYVHARMTSQQLLPVSRASYQSALKRNDIVTCLKVKLHVHVRVHVHVHAGVHFLCIVHKSLLVVLMTSGYVASCLTVVDLLACCMRLSRNKCQADNRLTSACSCAGRSAVLHVYDNYVLSVVHVVI